MALTLVTRFAIMLNETGPCGLFEDELNEKELLHRLRYQRAHRSKKRAAKQSQAVLLTLLIISILFLWCLISTIG